MCNNWPVTLVKPPVARQLRATMDELRQRAEHLLSAIGIDADTQDPDTLVISNPTNFQHVYRASSSPS